jgi:hypothetical protein
MLRKIVLACAIVLTCGGVQAAWAACQSIKGLSDWKLTQCLVRSGAGRPTKAIRPGKPKQMHSEKMKSDPTLAQPAGPPIMGDGTYR